MGDVLGRLREMEQQLLSTRMHVHLLYEMTPWCERGAMMALKTTIEEVEEGLVNYFRCWIYAPEGRRAKEDM